VQLERRFTYDPNPTPADRHAMNVIKAELARRGNEIKAQLGPGPERLTKLAAAIRQSQSTIDLILQRLNEQRAQAIADLNLLRFPIPNTSVPPPATRRRQFRAHRRVPVIRTAARDAVVRWCCGPLDGEEDDNYNCVRDSRRVEARRTVSANPAAFTSWLATNWRKVGGKFGNHRKYESLRNDSDRPGLEAVCSLDSLPTLYGGQETIPT
jgi:hypothetical protein